MTDSGAAIKPRVPVYKKEGTYEAPPAAVLNGSAPVEELPAIIRPNAAPRPDTSSAALIAAVQKVYAVVTSQIAYHEREAARLRESLKPFASHAPRHVAAQDDGSSAQAIRAVLDLADQLNLNGEQKS